MRACLIAVAALICGAAACAQGGTPADTGAMCRSFYDADTGKCRRQAQFDASNEADPLVDVHAPPRADKDDLSSEKYDQAVRAARRDRFTQSQKCSAARLSCRQACAAPAPAPAASSLAH